MNATCDCGSPDAYWHRGEYPNDTGSQYMCDDCWEAKRKKYPDTYLHVRCCRSGEEWIMPLRGNSLLSLERQVKRWIRQEFGGELFLASGIMRRLEGDYYAQIMMDGMSPESGICWESGGFYLSDTPNRFGRHN